MDELHNLRDDGVFLRREALAFGYDDRDLRAGLRAGALIRVRHGAYVDSDLWNSCSELEQYRLRCFAVLRSHAGSVMLSHTSAASFHGLCLWGADLTQVHVTRICGTAGRITSGVTYHEGTWSDADVDSDSGIRLTSPARAALETASLMTTEQGLVVLDSALDLRLADVDDLWKSFEQMERWPGTRHLQVTLRLTRPGAQSVGESRARFLCWSQHLPEPTLQYEVFDADGRLLGTTDFAWEEQHLLGEFDGKVKYEEFLRPDETPGDAVFREKRREDAIREATGWSMIRLVWADLYQPRATASRIRAQFRMPGAA